MQSGTGGLQLGGLQLAGLQLGGSQLAGSQLGGSHLGGLQLDGSQLGGSQLEDSQLGGFSSSYAAHIPRYRQLLNSVTTVLHSMMLGLMILW